MPSVRIRYHRLLGPAMLLLAAINVALFITSGWFLQLGGAVMFTILGILYFVRPFLIVDDEAIHAKSLLGYTVQRIRHGSFADLEVVPGAIVMGTSGARRRLKLWGPMVSKRDLNQLAAAIRDAREAKAEAQT
jgi:hypothetical protein